MSTKRQRNKDKVTTPITASPRKIGSHLAILGGKPVMLNRQAARRKTPSDPDLTKKRGKK